MSSQQDWRRVKELLQKRLPEELPRRVWRLASLLLAGVTDNQDLSREL